MPHFDLFLSLIKIPKQYVLEDIYRPNLHTIKITFTAFLMWIISLSSSKKHSFKTKVLYWKQVSLNVIYNSHIPFLKSIIWYNQLMWSLRASETQQHQNKPVRKRAKEMKKNKFKCKMLSIKEIKIKSTLKFHLNPVRMAYIQKATNHTCWHEFRKPGGRKERRKQESLFPQNCILKNNNSNKRI